MGRCGGGRTCILGFRTNNCWEKQAEERKVRTHWTPSYAWAPVSGIGRWHCVFLGVWVRDEHCPYLSYNCFYPMNKPVLSILELGPITEEAKLDIVRERDLRVSPWGSRGRGWPGKVSLSRPPSDPKVIVLGRCRERRSLPGRVNDKCKCSEVGTSSNMQGTEKPGRMERETGGRGS